MSNKAINSIVLVHGGFVDGSGWKARRRPDQELQVSIVQNPTISLKTMSP